MRIVHVVYIICKLRFRENERKNLIEIRVSSPSWFYRYLLVKELTIRSGKPGICYTDICAVADDDKMGSVECLSRYQMIRMLEVCLDES